MKKILSIIFAIYLVSYVGYQVFTHFFSVTPADQAVEILKRYLKAPSSFVKNSSEILWKGKSKEGGNAYVVSISYSASNSFGAMLAGCHFIAYQETAAGKIAWNESYGVRDFSEMRQICDASTPVEIKMKMANTLVDINFK